MNTGARRLFVVPLIAGAAALFAAASLEARVTKITIDSQSPLFSGRTFGSIGAYEQIKGTARGEIDPADRRNAVITDIQFAPLNANGRVEYVTSFTIYRPVDLSKANEKLSSLLGKKP